LIITERNMAKVTILYWDNIPSLVEARDSQGVHKQELDQKFQQLIDLVAMKKKLYGSDEYLMQWRKCRPYEVEGSAEQAAASVKEEIEAKYDEISKTELAKVAR